MAVCVEVGAEAVARHGGTLKLMPGLEEGCDEARKNDMRSEKQVKTRGKELTTEVRGYWWCRNKITMSLHRLALMSWEEKSRSRSSEPTMPKDSLT